MANTAGIEQINVGGTPYEVVDAAARKMVSDEYNSAETYAKGNLCIYNGKIYEAVKETTGTWDATSWEETTLAKVNSKLNGDIISLADKVSKIGFGKDTQLTAISDNEEHKYTVNLSKYGFTTPPIVILALRRAGYTGTAFYQLNNVNVSSFEYVIRLSDIHNIASAFINWIAIGE